MTDTNVVEFPKNYETLIEQGNDFFEAQKWDAANAAYKSAYEKRPNWAVSTLVAQTALKQQDPEAALAALDNEAAVFLDDGYEKTFFYLTILLAAGHFLQAHLVTQSGFKTAALQALAQQVLGQQEAHYQDDHPEAAQALVKESYGLVNGTVAENMAFLQQLRRVPLTVLLTVLPVITDNAYIHPFFKTDLLVALAPLHLDLSVPLQWFDTAKTVSLAHLSDTHQTPLFNKMAEALALDSDDPIAVQSLQQTLDLQFALLYPYSETVISDPELWLKILRQNYENLTAPSEDFESQRVIQWQNTLNKLLDALNY